VPGMNSGLSPADPTLVAAFRSALLHQGAIALLIVAFLWLLWATARTWRLVGPGATPATRGTAAASAAGEAVGTGGAMRTDGVAGSAGVAGSGGGRASRGKGALRGSLGADGFWGLRGARWGGAGRGGEARGRGVVRVGFGLIWVLDGILQAQPKMAGGLAAQVVEPSATSSPGWVQHVVNWGGTIWSFHPIQSAAAAVWIQLGRGIWLLVAARGPWSRLAGLASVAWGLVV
jgi:hypothetical protein